MDLACTLARGAALLHSGELSEAGALLQELLCQYPDCAEGYLQLGRSWKAMGHPVLAQACWERSVMLDPGSGGAWQELGNVCAELGFWQEAERALRHAVIMMPAHVKSWNNLGLALKAQYKLSEAVTCFERAISLQPDYVLAYHNCGNALIQQGKLHEAANYYLRGLQAAPGFVPGYSAYLFAMNYRTDLDPESLAAGYREFGARWEPPFSNGQRAFSVDRSPQRRLKVGYVSPDFRGHACSFFVLPLLAAHDERAVEIYGYSDVRAADEVTHRIRNACHHWRQTAGLNDEQLADLIRLDGIDVLVDLAGHSANNRLMAFARRPAPVQVTWLGMGHTTGLKAMDYFLTSPAFVPPGTEGLFSEQVYRLQRAPYVYRPHPASPEVTPLPARTHGAVTFGCFSRLIRLNDRVVQVWSRILKSLPDSTLVLNSRALADPGTRQFHLDRFQREGIDPSRVRMLASGSPIEALSAYRDIDLALDPFPHNAGTTTFEAMWMGVPVISLRDVPPLGRFGDALLKEVGLGDWVADSEEAYVQLACQWACDIEGLSELRASLRQRMCDSNLMDEPAFARAMEGAYREMWHAWLDGQRQPPAT